MGYKAKQINAPLKLPAPKDAEKIYQRSKIHNVVVRDFQTRQKVSGEIVERFEDFLFGDLLENLFVLKIFGRLFQQSEYIVPVLVDS